MSFSVSGGFAANPMLRLPKRPVLADTPQPVRAAGQATSR